MHAKGVHIFWGVQLGYFVSDWVICLIQVGDDDAIAVLYNMNCKPLQYSIFRQG